MDGDRTTTSLLSSCDGVFRLQAPLTADDLPLEMLALVLGSALDLRWGFCARAVCRTWSSVCRTRAHWVARVSCAASLLGAAPDDDPAMGTPQAAEAWCRSMGASPAWAGAALVASGRRKLVEYAINRPRAHDVASATMIPFQPLTAAVVRLCEFDDIETYLDAHPLAVIPDWAVETSLDVTDDDDPCRRERRYDVLLTLRERYALRFESVRDRGNVARPDQLCGRAGWIHAIARFMADDPKLARNVLRDCSHRRERMTADEATFLLACTGQLNNRYWAGRFEAMIVQALDGSAAIDPRVAIDLLARSSPPCATALLRRRCWSAFMASRHYWRLSGPCASSTSTTVRCSIPMRRSTSASTLPCSNSRRRRRRARSWPMRLSTGSSPARSPTSTSACATRVRRLLRSVCTTCGSWLCVRDRHTRRQPSCVVGPTHGLAISHVALPVTAAAA